MESGGASRPIPDALMRRPLASRMLGLILVSLFGEIAYALVTTFALPLYLSNTLMWREEIIGPVISAFLLAETVAKPVWGNLSDRIGRKPLIVIGVLISAIAVLAMAFTDSYWGFLALSAVNGVGGAALWPNVFASVADLTDDEERVGAMSAFNMMYMIGLGLSPQVGSLIFRLAGDRPSLVFPATTALFGIAMLAAAFMVPWVRGAAHHEDWPRGPQHGVVGPVLLFFMVMSFFQTLGLQIMNGSIVLYVNQEIGLSPENIGWPFAVLALIVAAAAIPIGTWGGRWGRVKSVKLGLLVAATGMVLLPLNSGLAWWLIVATPMILGFLLSIPAWLAIITDLAPVTWRGRIFGYVATAQGLGAVLGPTVGLYLFGRVSHAAPFYASGAILAMTLVGAMFGLREGMRAVKVNGDGGADDNVAPA